MHAVVGLAAQTELVVCSALNLDAGRRHILHTVRLLLLAFSRFHCRMNCCTSIRGCNDQVLVDCIASAPAQCLPSPAPAVQAGGAAPTLLSRSLSNT